MNSSIEQQKQDILELISSMGANPALTNQVKLLLNKLAKLDPNLIKEAAIERQQNDEGAEVGQPANDKLLNALVKVAEVESGISISGSDGPEAEGQITESDIKSDIKLAKAVITIALAAAALSAGDVFAVIDLAEGLKELSECAEEEQEENQEKSIKKLTEDLKKLSGNALEDAKAELQDNLLGKIAANKNGKLDAETINALKELYKDNPIMQQMLEGIHNNPLSKYQREELIQKLVNDLEKAPVTSPTPIYDFFKKACVEAYHDQQQSVDKFLNTAISNGLQAFPILQSFNGLNAFKNIKLDFASPEKQGKPAEVINKNETQPEPKGQQSIVNPSQLGGVVEKLANQLKDGNILEGVGPAAELPKFDNEPKSLQDAVNKAGQQQPIKQELQQPEGQQQQAAGQQLQPVQTQTNQQSGTEANVGERTIGGGNPQQPTTGPEGNSSLQQKDAGETNSFAAALKGSKDGLNLEAMSGGENVNSNNPISPTSGSGVRPQEQEPQMAM